MNKIWLREDNLGYRHGRIMVLIAIYILYAKFNYNPFSTFQNKAPGQATIRKTWLRGDKSINIKGRLYTDKH